MLKRRYLHLCSTLSLALWLSVQLFAVAYADQSECTRFGDNFETPAAWTTCVQDGDCVLGRNVCGFPMGLNAGHVADQDQLNQCVGPRIACPMIYLDPNNYRAACQAGQCQAVSKDGSNLPPLGSSRGQPE